MNSQKQMQVKAVPKLELDTLHGEKCGNTFKFVYCGPFLFQNGNARTPLNTIGVKQNTFFN